MIFQHKKRGAESGKTGTTARGGADGRRVRRAGTRRTGIARRARQQGKSRLNVSDKAYKRGGGKPYYQQRGASPVGVAPQRSEQWKTPNAMQTAKQIPPSRAANSPRPSRRTARAARIPRLAGTANKQNEKRKSVRKGGFSFAVFRAALSVAAYCPPPYCSRGERVL